MCIRWLLLPITVTIQRSLLIWEFSRIFQDERVCYIYFCCTFKGCIWSSCRASSSRTQVWSPHPVPDSHTAMGRAGWQEKLSPGLDEESHPLCTSGAPVRAGSRHVCKEDVWHNESCRMKQLDLSISYSHHLPFGGLQWTGHARCAQCVLSLCHLKESVLRHTSAMQTKV